MKIGVMSDTHGSLPYFEKALDLLEDCDVIFHIGDVLYHGPRDDLPEGYNPKGVIEKINNLDNMIIVRGNCDADVDQMVIKHPIEDGYVLTEVGRVTFLLDHGYLEPKEEIIKRAKAKEANVLILGHTHVKELYMDEDLVVLNPGSTSIPKDGSHSVAIIEIEPIEGNNHQVDMDINLVDITTGEIIEL